MHRVELPVFRVAGIEGERYDAGRVAGVGHELGENVSKIEVRRELLSRYIQNIECAVLVVDKETRRRQRGVRWLRAQRRRAANLPLEINRAWSLPAVRWARERDARVILQQDRRSILADLRLRWVLCGHDERASEKANEQCESKTKFCKPLNYRSCPCHCQTPPYFLQVLADA